MPIAPVELRTGLWTRGLPRPETPSIRDSPPAKPEETLKDIHSAIGFYDQYARPLSAEEKRDLSETLANIHIGAPSQDQSATLTPKEGENIPAPPDPDARVRGPDNVDVRNGDRSLGEYWWVEPEKSSIPELAEHADVAGVSQERQELDYSETQDYGLESFLHGLASDPGIRPEYSETHEYALRRGRDHGPDLAEDVRQAFWWAGGDAIDRLSGEGASFGEAWENLEKWSPPAGIDDHPDSGKGWWM